DPTVGGPSGTAQDRCSLLNPADGKLHVRIQGSHFELVSDVSINQTHLVYTVVFDQLKIPYVLPYIDAVIPVGAASGPIQVTTHGGTARSLTFTVYQPPTINSISLADGWSGRTCTYQGSNIQNILMR